MNRTSTFQISIHQIIITTLILRICAASTEAPAVFGWQDIPPVTCPTVPEESNSVFGWQDIPPAVPSPTAPPEDEDVS